MLEKTIPPDKVQKIEESGNSVTLFLLNGITMKTDKRQFSDFEQYKEQQIKFASQNN